MRDCLSLSITDCVVVTTKLNLLYEDVHSAKNGVNVPAGVQDSSTRLVIQYDFIFQRPA
jgi:hypothetical protein